MLEPYSPLIIVTDSEYRQNKIPEDVIIIKVVSAEEAYWKFVNFYRYQFKIPIVAITGTSGKTTTKEMIKHILSFEKKVTATNLSNNSRTAFLQYLLSIEDDTEAAIIETPVGSPGDISKAGKYFKPTIGIITNIGAHHLNYCKTLEGYIEAKGEMVQVIEPNGTLIINSEDVNTSKIDMTNFRGRIIKVGKHMSCEFRASHIRYNLNGMQFTLHHNMKDYEIFVPGFGEHQVYNALTSIAAVYGMGVTIPMAANHLQSFQQLNKHLQLFEGINHSILIDDTWSLTTTSLKAALQVLNELGKDKKKVAVIGTITDLGSSGYKIHEQAGELIHDIGVDVLITIGEHASIMAEKVMNLGMDIPVYKFKNSTLVPQLLRDIVDNNTIILIKGDMYSKALHELATKLKKPSISSE
ncbi:Mur ligase family protein [Rummeliibacillus pycnus]|uniref:Mur ligase family protein n=1 Tax=Rummeliibacillus pycnus TaxID=101070 RepID=UPI0037C551A5